MMMLTLLTVFGITLGAFLLVVAGMAVGVMMGRREISGSCGGLGNQPGSEQTSCSLCSNPDAACRELRDAMQGQREDSPEQSLRTAQQPQAAESKCETA